MSRSSLSPAEIAAALGTDDGTGIAAMPASWGGYEPKREALPVQSNGLTSFLRSLFGSNAGQALRAAQEYGGVARDVAAGAPSVLQEVPGRVYDYVTENPGETVREAGYMLTPAGGARDAVEGGETFSAGVRSGNPMQAAGGAALQTAGALSMIPLAGAVKQAGQRVLRGAGEMVGEAAARGAAERGGIRAIPADVLGDATEGGIRSLDAVQPSMSGPSSRVIRLPDGSIAPAADDRASVLTGSLRPDADPVRGRVDADMRRLQREQLTPEQLERVETLKGQSAEFKAIADYMSPLEISKVIARGGNVDALARLTKVLPTAFDMSAAAKAGMPKQGWYRASSEALIDVFGQEDAPRFAALLAATSPQTSVESNLTNALNIWKNWTAAGRPTDERSIKSIMGSSVQGAKGEDSVLNAWVNNSITALSSRDPTNLVLSGPKVDSFYRNLADDVRRVTNDAWISNLLGVSQDLFSRTGDASLARLDPGMGTGYSTVSALTRKAGDRIGLLPSEAQETMWSFAMPLYEAQAKLGLPAREVLQRGLLTPEMIRGTPDFSTLLGQGNYRRILQESGYGPQVEALRPFQFPDARMESLSNSEQNALLRMAGTLENLKGVRDLDSRIKQYPVSLPKGAGVVFEQAEYIPGVNTGVRPDVAEKSPKAKTQFSGALSKEFVDNYGRDRMQVAAFGPERVGTGRAAQGVYDPQVEGAPVEFNPVTSYPVTLPIGPTGFSATDLDTMGGIAAFRGLMTGQRGTAIHGHVLPNDKGRPSPDSAFLYTSGKLTPNQAAQLQRVAPDQAIADTGEGVGVLNYMGTAPLQKPQLDEMARIAAGTKKDGTPNDPVAYDKTRYQGGDQYTDLGTAWDAPQGTGAVSTVVLGQLDKVPPRRLQAIDKQARDIAGRLHKEYAAQVGRGQQIRGDLMTTLEVIREGGVEGLRAAIKAGVPVASLAALGLLPDLGEDGQTED
jgi:hypothetical protein